VEAARARREAELARAEAEAARAEAEAARQQAREAEERLYDEADHKLRWPAGASTATPLCKCDDGTARHFILPAALTAIAALARRGRAPLGRPRLLVLHGV
jgi:multidrug efflux pump subunit AcrA (membrane-fusion protein)